MFSCFLTVFARGVLKRVTYIWGGFGNGHQGKTGPKNPELLSGFKPGNTSIHHGDALVCFLPKEIVEHFRTEVE